MKYPKPVLFFAMALSWGGVACEGKPPPPAATSAAAVASASAAGPAIGGIGSPTEGAKVGLVGQPAPDVQLAFHDGSGTMLSALKGKHVVLYFYPKDDTPGCRIEAQGFRDHHKALTDAGIKVFGVSMQGAASHRAFIEKERLPFSLVVDDGSVAKAFGVPVLGEFASRQTILIGPDGIVKKVWRSVSPSGHAEEVLAAAG